MASGAVEAVAATSVASEQARPTRRGGRQLQPRLGAMEVEAGAGPRLALPERRQNPWAVLDEHILPHIKRGRAADEELVAAERSVANKEEGALDRLAAAKNEHELANALRKTVIKYYLGINK